MSKEVDISLHEYYKQAGFNPVYAGFSSTKDLDQYDVLRRKMFENNLRLPVGAFTGKQLLEFGPASGENSLIFARWGSHLTLIEPVSDFIDALRSYFKLYGLTAQLDEIKCASIEEYKSQILYDFIIAEGFVYTIGKPEYWLPLLLSFAKKDAFIVTSYYEMTGSLIEILQAKVFQILSSRSSEDQLILAQKIFQKKWDRVPHVRKFESWVGDVLKNPVIKWENLNTLYHLQDIMATHGVSLWSSWPSISYTDVSWIKKTNNPTQNLAKCKQAYVRLIPSLISGKEIDARTCSMQLGEELLNKLNEEMRHLCSSVEILENEGLNRILHCHQEAGVLLKQVVDENLEKEFFDLWQEISTCLSCLNSKKDEEVIALFNGEGPLSKWWGSPNFFNVWHRFPEEI